LHFVTVLQMRFLLIQPIDLSISLNIILYTTEYPFNTTEYYFNTTEYHVNTTDYHFNSTDKYLLYLMTYLAILSRL